MRTTSNTNGNRVGSMKRKAMEDFIPRIKRTVEQEGKTTVTLKPKGMTPPEFENELFRNGMGYTKYTGWRYDVFSLNSTPKA
jgi:hypothetical protein